MAEVVLINAAGQRFVVDEAEVDAALSDKLAGFRLESPDEAAARTKAEKFGDRPIAAGLAGAARGASFGLSDLALTKTGAVDPQTLEGLRSENEAASIAGDVIGTGASLLIPGGALGVGTRAGAAAGKGAAKLIGKEAAETVGGKVLQAGVSGGAEGVLYGAGAALSDSVLGETELTAEKLISYGGLGLLLGSGAGSVGTLAQEGVKAGSKALGAKGRKLVSDAEVMAEGMARDIKGAELKSLRGDAGQVSSEAGNILKNLDEIKLPRDGAPRRAVDVADDLSKQADAIELLAIEGRAKAEAQGINPDEFDVGRLGEYLSKGSKVDKAQKAAAKVKQHERAALMVRERAAALRELPPDQMINTVDEAIVKAIDDVRADPAFIDMKQNVAKNNLVRYAEIAPEVAAKRQAFESGAANFEGDVAALKAELLSPKLAARRGKELAVRYGPPLLGSAVGNTAVGAVAGYAVGGDMGAAVGALGGAGLRPALQAFYRTATKYPAIKNALGQALQALERNSPESLGRYAGTLGAASARGVDELVFTHAALAESDPEYREVMAAAGLPMETDPTAIRRAQALSALDAAQQKHDNALTDSIDGFLSGKGKARPPKESPFPTDHKETLAILSDMATNPLKMTERIAAALGPVADDAPNVAAALSATASRAVSFLYEKAPKPPPNEVLPALSRPWKPSDSELAAFNRTAEAVMNPEAVLSHLQRGTITREAVEALQAVYPKLYEELKAKALERVALHKSPISYRQRMALGALLGVPLDSSANPKTVAAFQAMYAQQQQPQPQGGGKPLNLSQAEAPTSERIANRS